MRHIPFILVGLIVGALAGRVVGSPIYGAMGDIAAAVVGAVLAGGVFATFLSVAGAGLFMSLFLAFVGAVTMLWLIRLIAAAVLTGRPGGPRATATPLC